MKECNNCKYKDCWEHAEPCDSCTNLMGKPTHCEPQTNYDRLISKTPEELAAYMGDVQTWGGCPNHGARNCKENCADCWLDWLKSPVEVDNGT